MGISPCATGRMFPSRSCQQSEPTTSLAARLRDQIAVKFCLAVRNNTLPVNSKQTGAPQHTGFRSSSSPSSSPIVISATIYRYVEAGFEKITNSRKQIIRSSASGPGFGDFKIQRGADFYRIPRVSPTSPSLIPALSVRLISLRL